MVSVGVGICGLALSVWRLTFKGDFDLAQNASSNFRVFSCLNDGYGPG